MGPNPGQGRSDDIEYGETVRGIFVKDGIEAKEMKDDAQKG